jgi:cysteine desulfurase
MSMAALEAFCEQSRKTGNASSLHAPGRAARRVVEEARESLAHSLDARPSEVIFTSGGTEADNLAIKGMFWGRRAQKPGCNRVLISSIEHHAVMDPAFWLAEYEGASIVQLSVDSTGVVDLGALAEELAAHKDSIALVSVMWANNEVGTIEPVREVARLAHRYGVPFHTDAVQAVGQIPVSFAQSGADALTLTGHKLGGPVGVGALLATRDLAIEAVQHGGGQERGIRSGTLDTPGIRAFAVAVAEAVANQEAHAARMASLRDQLIAGIRAAVPDAILRGPEPARAGVSTVGAVAPGSTARELAAEPSSTARVVAVAPGSTAREMAAEPNHALPVILRGGHGPESQNLADANTGRLSQHREVRRSKPPVPDPAITRIPGNVHFTFPGCEGDSLIYLLDAAGIAASTGSACTAGIPQPSHVLLAMGVPEDEARGALRFTLGEATTESDVTAVIQAIPAIVERARLAGLAGSRQ